MLFVSDSNPLQRPQRSQLQRHGVRAFRCEVSVRLRPSGRQCLVEWVLSRARHRVATSLHARHKQAPSSLCFPPSRCTDQAWQNLLTSLGWTWDQLVAYQGGAALRETLLYSIVPDEYLTETGMTNDTYLDRVATLQGQPLMVRTWSVCLHARRPSPGGMAARARGGRRRTRGWDL